MVGVRPSHATRLATSVANVEALGRPRRPALSYFDSGVETMTVNQDALDEDDEALFLQLTSNRSSRKWCNPPDLPGSNRAQQAQHP